MILKIEWNQWEGEVCFAFCFFLQNSTWGKLQKSENYGPFKYTFCSEIWLGLIPDNKTRNEIFIKILGFNIK